jgi:outer membrane receptor protein involved in Fe transport
MDYDLNDDWTLNLGVRWFEYDREKITTNAFPQGLPPSGSFDTGGRYVSAGVKSDTVYKIGTTYNLDDNIMVYALYSEGFRLGGNNSPRAAATGFVPSTYLSDKVSNSEIGIKSQFANGRVLLNVIAFDIQWDDVQISQSSVNGQWWLRGTINGGKGENKGVEFEAKWQATDRLYLYGSGSFGDPKYTEEIVRLDDVVPAGTPMVWAYKKSVSIGAEYTIPDVLGGDLWFGYNHSYQGKKWNNLDNAIAQDPDGLAPAWNLANAHAGLTMNNGWEFQVTIRNIWDERAVNALWNDSNGEFFGDLRFDNMRSYARPTTVGLTVRKRFD